MKTKKRQQPPSINKDFRDILTMITNFFFLVTSERIGNIPRSGLTADPIGQGFSPPYSDLYIRISLPI